MFRAILCPSSGAREYYTDGRCLWYLVLWFSDCRYGVELEVMLPETCWACNKICNKYHLLHLVGILFPHNVCYILFFFKHSACTCGQSFHILTFLLLQCILQVYYSSTSYSLNFTDSGKGHLNVRGPKKEWIMNPNGKSYVCILHEYVQHALKKQPSYEFKELGNLWM